MAASCDIVPRITNKDGKKVESILFTDLLALGLRRKEAVDVYKHVHSTYFKKDFGDWENYPRRVSHLLDANGEPTLAAIKPLIPTLYPSSYNAQVASSGKLDNTLESIARKQKRLLASFEKLGINVHVKYDSTLLEPAYVEGNVDGSATITLNPDKVFDDTIPHEFGHIYVDLLGYNHPLVQQGLTQLFDSPLYHEIRKLYPDLHNVPFEKEVLVTAIGREAATIFANPASIDKWNFWLNRFLRAIGDLLGVERNVARRLAMEMITGQMRKGDGRVSSYRQFQRATPTTADVESEVAASGIELNADESKYTDGKREYDRVTDFTSKMFGTRKHNKTPGQAAADIEYETQKLATTAKITVNGVEYTYDELVTEKELDSNTFGRIWGKLGHAIIQNFIKPSPALENQIREYSNGKEGVSKQIPLFHFNWIKGTLKETFQKVGINVLEDVPKGEKDELVSEQTIFSKLLGIAGTIDGLVRHANGDYSIVDWKFGKSFFKNEDIGKFLRYGHNQTEELRDSNMNRAKLEVMLRALMFKEQFGDDIHYRWLKVAHLAKKGTTISEVDVTSFLGLIASYYADPANGKLAEYKQLQERGLLDPHNYINISSELEDIDSNLPPADLLEKNKRKLNMIQNRIGNLNYDHVSLDDKAEIERLTREIAKLEGYKGSVIGDSGIADMGFFKRWIGNQYSTANPMVQMFFKVMNNALQVARNIVKSFNDKHDELLKDVLKEYYAEHGMENMLNKMTLGAINKLKYKDLYNFMWVHKNEPGRTGWYANVIQQVGNTYIGTDGRTYSKAKYEYNKYVRETMAKEYKKLVAKPAKVENGKVRTIGEVLELPAELEEDFMPRYMTSFEEVVERKGILSKDAAIYQFDAIMSDFTESEFQPKNIQHGIPIKYMGSPEIIKSENHTFSTELAFKNFMNTLVMKDNLDEVYSVGAGVVQVLQGVRDAEGQMKYANEAAFLKDQIYLNVLNMKEQTKWTRMGWSVTIRGRERKISPDRLLRTLKSWVSNSTMWLNLIGAGANAALIVILSANNAIKGSISKRMGVNDEDVHFTISTMLAAQKDYLSYIYDSMRGKKEENKLWNIAKNFNYLPDNFDYATRKSDMVGVKNKLLDMGHFYIFHGIGEEYGAMVTLAAQMRQYKINGKPAWEQYDAKGNYTGAKRGVDKNNQEIGELTTQEITAMKRVYSKIHGGYRQDERTALELTAIGQLATQFRRFLPNALENLWQGQYDDTSSGKYTALQRADGETQYDWIARKNEGRVMVLVKWLATMARLKKGSDYAFTKMPAEQKQQVIDLLITGGMFFSMSAAAQLLFGDDDDDDPWKLRMERLTADATQGLHFNDLLQSLQSQTIALPKLYKISDAAFDVLFDGIIQGKRTKRGDMKGINTLVGSTPLGSSYTQLERFGILSDEGAVTNR